MKVLLDTHAFLWFVSGSEQLSSRARSAIEAAENEVWMSIASLWEIAVKHSLGKLAIKGQYDEIVKDLETNNIFILPINFNHLIIFNKLPFFLRDPFDRLLIAQAISENMPIISVDSTMDEYFKDMPIARLW